MNIEIANRLVELRKKMGLSQEELADKLGISRQLYPSGSEQKHHPTRIILFVLPKSMAFRLMTC